jgi:hypothetical protein
VILLKGLYSKRDRENQEEWMTAKKICILTLIMISLITTFLISPAAAQSPTKTEQQNSLNLDDKSTEDTLIIEEELDSIRVDGKITESRDTPLSKAQDVIKTGNWGYLSDDAYKNFPAIRIPVIKKVQVSAQKAEPPEEMASTVHHRRSLASRGASPLPGQKYVRMRVMEDISPLVLKYAKLYNVSPYIVRSIIEVESSFNPHAISCSGACGLMQLKPSTAYDMGITNFWNPEKNIEAGTKYMKLMLDKFGNLTTALAAYNQGPGAVQRAGGQPPNHSAQHYILKVLRSMENTR